MQIAQKESFRRGLGVEIRRILDAVSTAEDARWFPGTAPEGTRRVPEWSPKIPRGLPSESPKLPKVPTAALTCPDVRRDSPDVAQGPRHFPRSSWMPTKLALREPLLIAHMWTTIFRVPNLQLWVQSQFIGLISSIFADWTKRVSCGMALVSRYEFRIQCQLRRVLGWFLVGSPQIR